MPLNLNDRFLYKEFPGKVTEQMPLLIAEGRVPLSVAGLMERRLYSKLPDWRDNYFTTGDAILYHPNGNIKIVVEVGKLREVTAQSTLSEGALLVSEGFYTRMCCPEFTREEVTNWAGEDLTPQEAKKNKIWRAFAQDQSLLNAYVDKMSAEMKARFGYERSMGVHLSKPQEKVVMRALAVIGLVGRSLLCGRYSLGGDGGRLVGVASEAIVREEV